MKILTLTVMAVLSFSAVSEVVIKTDDGTLHYNECTVYYTVVTNDPAITNHAGIGCDDAPRNAPPIVIEGNDFGFLINFRTLVCPVEFFLHAPEYEEGPLSLYLDCREDLIFKGGFE